LGVSLGALLASGDCVLLTGDLGAGKSVIARGMARAQGIDCPMPSPTFTIMIPYEGKHKFCHFDLYRLSDPDEFYAAGLDEYIGGDAICVIEWPEMADLQLKNAISVDMRRGEGFDDRIIEISGLKNEEALAKWRYYDADSRG